VLLANVSSVEHLQLPIGGPSMSLFSAYHRLVEEKIREAVQRGEFDNLPGSGEPLQLDDDSRLPDDLRIAYKILKNADCLPPELQLRKDIRQTEELLAGIQDTQEKYRQMKKLNFMIMKLNMMRRVSPLLEEGQRYYEKVVDRIAKT
jgi:hypothetical protein